jgi:hypothetical protein
MDLSIPFTPSPQVARKLRPPLPPTKGRMLQRLNHLRALAHGRARDNKPFGDLERWAMLLAECMLYHDKGCDYFSFRDALRPVPALREALDEETVMAAIHTVTATYKRRGTDYRTISATTAGKWLGLTAEECGLCGIT